MENNETPQTNKNIFNYDFEEMIREKENKKAYRRLARIIGIPYFICFAISFFWSEIYLLSASYIGISAKEAIDFVNKPGINQILQIFLSLLLFTFPFILSVIISGKTISETVILSKPKKNSLLPYLLLGFSFCIFSNVAVSYAGGLFESFGVDYSVDFGENPTGLFGILLSIIAVSIVPALIEEFAFRGVVVGVLLPFGESFAVFSSALLFGIMHGNFEQMPFAILVGIVLGFVRIKTGSLWATIILHFLNNFISICIDYLNKIVSAQVIDIFYAVFISFALLLLIPSFILCEKRFKDSAFSLENGDGNKKEKEKYKFFFSSPIIIVSVALYFLEAVRYFF